MQNNKRNLTIIGMYLSVISTISILTQLYLASKLIDKLTEWENPRLKYILFNTRMLDLKGVFLASVFLLLCGSLLFIYSLLPDKRKQTKK